MRGGKDQYPQGGDMLKVEHLTTHGGTRLPRARSGARETISLIRMTGVRIPRNESWLWKRPGTEYFVVYNADSCNYFIAVVNPETAGVITILPQADVWLHVSAKTRREAYLKAVEQKYGQGAKAR